MAILSRGEAESARALAAIPFANPFLEERIELERRALGPGYRTVGKVLRARPGASSQLFPEIGRIWSLTERVVARLREGIVAGEADEAEIRLYEDLVLYRLYQVHANDLESLIRPLEQGGRCAVPAAFWRRYEDDFTRALRPEGMRLPSDHDPELIFAGYFQVERAFTYLFQSIQGGSMPAARLRAAAWESIFGADMRRYLRILHRQMADIPTLILGPSGSGKELVARAIGMSGFLRYDAKARQFDPFEPADRQAGARPARYYLPLNLSALSPNLIESELFGHARGAFNGAIEREGWLAACPPAGAVFLDEIGELDLAIQVKLLRVLETRRFEKVGSTESRAFRGKLIAATNRDLAAEIGAKRFRDDFFFRLCADQIFTPGLAEQLADAPDDLGPLVHHIARDVLGLTARYGHEPRPDTPDEAEALRLAGQAVDWIRRELGPDYPWPGNFRELSQCVRNIMIRGTYHPPAMRPARLPDGPLEAFLRDVRDVKLTDAELRGRYFALAYHRSGKAFNKAGKTLKLDARTVRDGHDRDFLGQLEARRDPRE